MTHAPPTRCHSRAKLALAALALAALALVAACATPGRRGPVGTPPPGGRGAKLALLPLQNLSGRAAPIAELERALADTLRARGLQLVDGAELDAFLARHRIRYSGGIDGANAGAARDELGVDGVLITALEQYDVGNPPKLAIAMRLVSATRDPRILWTGSVSRGGDDAPGLLDLGVIRSMRALRPKVLDSLAGALNDFLRGGRPRAVGCPRARRFAPRSFFRSRAFQPTGRRTVAVLPFVNHTDRRKAGELVATEAIRQLQATAIFEVLDPGIIRERMLALRIILENGISLPTARLLLDTLGADVVLVGEVHDYDEVSATPTVAFSALMLDGNRDRILWRSMSESSGDDGVWFFGLGRVGTAGDLACHMIGSIVDQLQLGHVLSDISADDLVRDPTPDEGSKP